MPIPFLITIFVSDCHFHSATEMASFFHINIIKHASFPHHTLPRCNVCASKGRSFFSAAASRPRSGPICVRYMAAAGGASNTRGGRAVNTLYQARQSTRAAGSPVNTGGSQHSQQALQAGQPICVDGGTINTRSQHHPVGRTALLNNATAVAWQWQIRYIAYLSSGTIPLIIIALAIGRCNGASSLAISVDQHCEGAF